MGDEADVAQGVEELHRNIALNNRKPEAPSANGFCLNCEEPVEAPRRWCDSDCRDDWERLNG